MGTRDWAPQEAFEYVLGKARSLLILRGVGEATKPLRWLPVPTPLRKLKDQVDGWAGAVDGALCEVVLVQAVTALEVYLEGTYYRCTGEEWRGPKLENVRALTRWSERIGRSLDPFQAVTQRELGELFQIRHVIVHRGGIVDRLALKHGLPSMARERQPVNEILTFEVTGGALETIAKMPRSIEAQLAGAEGPRDR